MFTIVCVSNGREYHNYHGETPEYFYKWENGKELQALKPHFVKRSTWMNPNFRGGWKPLTIIKLSVTPR